MKLVTVTEMRAIEKEADSSGLTYAQMMENAGSGLADVVLDLFFPSSQEGEALGLVGPGNNGGGPLRKKIDVVERIILFVKRDRPVANLVFAHVVLVDVKIQRSF